jgi:hypothetical protein
MGGMTTPPPKKPTRHLRAVDLRAVAQLATDATQAVTHMAEGVHQSVWRTLGARDGADAGKTSGLTGLIYKSISGATQWIGQGLNTALTRLEPWLQRLEGDTDESVERAAVIAALNGVMGDRLQASANPLTTPMTLRHEGKVLTHASQPDAQAVTGKVLLVIHGLCMNDLQWTTQHQGAPVNHASAISAALGYTPLYLRYNSGLHVSSNGAELACLLDDVLRHWPVPLQDISVLTHSMGGLVIRSAVHCATQAGLQWPQHLKHMVFMGTPHHGAPLERAGNWVDVILGSTPYSRPFAKLGQLRSSGVTDLRYGLVLDSDWQGHDRFRRQPDQRTPLPLPTGVACFTVAATLAGKRSAMANRLLGDGLVPLHSALGQHEEPRRCLNIPASHQHIAYRTGHLQLLSDPAVTQQVLQWLAT